MRALPIQNLNNFQPSGLIWFEGQLLTISDKHDDAIFALELTGEEAIPHVFREIIAPPEEPKPFDLEGITLGEDGELLLASEERSRVLAVPRSGRAYWLGESLLREGQRVGLFRQENAGLEGITRLPNGDLLLCAEREPRGFVRLSGGAPYAWQQDTSIYALPAGRPPDCADLTSVGDKVYELERGSHMIVRLDPTQQSCTELEAYSYARTENDPRFAYENSRFARAEGLALDHDHIYVLLDNNGDARLGAPEDRRPLLFIFARPHEG